MFLNNTRKKVRLSADCLSKPQLLVISYAFNCLNAWTTRHARFYMNRRGEERREGKSGEETRGEERREGYRRGDKSLKRMNQTKETSQNIK